MKTKGPKIAALSYEVRGHCLMTSDVLYRSRPAFSSMFENSQTAAQRAAAQACLPTLPGPLPASEYEVPDNTTSEHSEAGSSGQIGGQEEQRSANPVSRSNTTQQQGNTHASRSIEAFDLPAITHRADLLVVAVGKPEMVCPCERAMCASPAWKMLVNYRHS